MWCDVARDYKGYDDDKRERGRCVRWTSVESRVNRVLYRYDVWAKMIVRQETNSQTQDSWSERVPVRVNTVKRNFKSQSHCGHANESFTRVQMLELIQILEQYRGARIDRIQTRCVLLVSRHSRYPVKARLQKASSFVCYQKMRKLQGVVQVSCLKHIQDDNRGDLTVPSLG